MLCNTCMMQDIKPNYGTSPNIFFVIASTVTIQSLFAICPDHCLEDAFYRGVDIERLDLHPLDMSLDGAVEESPPGIDNVHLSETYCCLCILPLPGLCQPLHTSTGVTSALLHRA